MRVFVRCMCALCFFLFKQKTAYEMRISDWSSDVCSSDLHIARRISHCEVRLLSALFPELEHGELLRGEFRHTLFKVGWSMARPDSFKPAHDVTAALAAIHLAQCAATTAMAAPPGDALRSEERRVGTECGST